MGVAHQFVNFILGATLTTTLGGTISNHFGWWRGQICTPC